MAIPQPQTQRMSFDHYLEWEAYNELRHEFYKGEVFAMAGATKVHNMLLMNMSAHWLKAVRKRGCNLFSENVKLELLPKQYYVYPDLMLTCAPADLDLKDKLLVRSPSLIVEVLSPSTASYDKGLKMDYYFQLPSLQYYVVVDSERQHIACWARADESGTKWTYTMHSQAEEVLDLPLLGLQISVQEVYEGVSFEENTENQAENGHEQR